ncbi:NAD(P)-dependent oxidoreductase [Chitinophaga parva]|uniref:NAD(P)-dependent oxidoreductase n=1 Tax=Chitinophaga parva TaxID=2169414 RepID=A0A2T7BP17_9BACT|nr:SDR family oxidoreductase [Chitinophaga parva]PUZ29412.1 NAD(P)-dependent oxidoreductase [Chitinophaga parva]
MILVTGATGKLGGKVIDTLIRNQIDPGKIAALVRQEEKAVHLKEQGIDIRIGDYDDRASLDRAMDGIDRVLLVSGVDRSKIMQQHKNVIDAAKQGGVRSLSYTGNCLKDRYTLVNDIMLSHFETEDYIMASGLNYQIFRNVLYMDSMAHYMLGKDFLAKGINLPAGDGRVAYALRSEEAEAIGNVLAHEHLDSRSYNFTGTRAYSFYDVAETLSELYGVKITYTPVSMEAYTASALSSGVPEQAVKMMAPFFTDIANGQGSMVATDLENALGRKPADLKTGLKALLNL